jgi:hypothetical protein
METVIATKEQIAIKAMKTPPDRRKAHTFSFTLASPMRDRKFNR